MKVKSFAETGSTLRLKSHLAAKARAATTLQSLNTTARQIRKAGLWVDIGQEVRQRDDVLQGRAAPVNWVDKTGRFSCTVKDGVHQFPLGNGKSIARSAARLEKEGWRCQI